MKDVLLKDTNRNKEVDSGSNYSDVEIILGIFHRRGNRTTEAWPSFSVIKGAKIEAILKSTRYSDRETACLDIQLQRLLC